MGDKYWGFQQCYGHRTLPSKWSRNNGFTVYADAPLLLKTFCTKPSMGSAFAPIQEQRYKDRTQRPDYCQSVYGTHREVRWVDGLRHSSVKPKRKPIKKVSDFYTDLKEQHDARIAFKAVRPQTCPVEKSCKSPQRPNGPNRSKSVYGLRRRGVVSPLPQENPGEKINNNDTEVSLPLAPISPRSPDAKKATIDCNLPMSPEKKPMQVMLKSPTLKAINLVQGRSSKDGSQPPSSRRPLSETSSRFPRSDFGSSTSQYSGKFSRK